MSLARAVVLALLFASAIARADGPAVTPHGDGIVVTQLNRRFSAAELTVGRGTTITIVNEDSIRHNIAIRRPDGTDRTGLVQPPGSADALTFDQAGLFQLHCLIHPTMHLAVTVR